MCSAALFCSFAGCGAGVCGVAVCGFVVGLLLFMFLCLVLVLLPVLVLVLVLKYPGLLGPGFSVGCYNLLRVGRVLATGLAPGLLGLGLVECRILLGLGMALVPRHLLALATLAS